MKREDRYDNIKNTDKVIEYSRFSLFSLYYKDDRKIDRNVHMGRYILKEKFFRNIDRVFITARFLLVQFSLFSYIFYIIILKSYCFYY